MKVLEGLSQKDVDDLKLSPDETMAVQRVFNVTFTVIIMQKPQNRKDKYGQITVTADLSRNT